MSCEGAIAGIADAIRTLVNENIRDESMSPAQKTSLAVSPAFRQFVLDQLEELGDVTPRSMFGGVGLYRRGVFFGIIARDVLYLKVDDTTRADYEREGMHPFRPYPRRGGTMKYYAVPVGVLESAAELVSWARKAVVVAESAI
jgi:DNA transformation protein and related proteins